MSKDLAGFDFPALLTAAPFSLLLPLPVYSIPCQTSHSSYANPGSPVTQSYNSLPGPPLRVPSHIPGLSSSPTWQRTIPQLLTQESFVTLKPGPRRGHCLTVCLGWSLAQVMHAAVFPSCHHIVRAESSQAFLL